MEFLISLWLLFHFGKIRGGAANIPRAGVTLVVIATAAALVTGLPAMRLRRCVAHLLGYSVTDAIILTLAGATTFGYAAMAALELGTSGLGRWVALGIERAPRAPGPTSHWHCRSAWHSAKGTVVRCPARA